MAFEIAGALRPVLVAWIVAWPSAGLADPTPKPAAPPSPPPTASDPLPPLHPAAPLRSASAEISAATGPAPSASAIAALPPADAAGTPLAAPEPAVHALLPIPETPRSASRFETLSRELSLDHFAVGKRGVEYRNSVVIHRRELTYRIWGGRKHRQPALGIEIQPRLRDRKLRIGAYGTQSRVGFTLRLRY